MLQVVGDNFEISPTHDRLIEQELGQKIDKYLQSFDPDLRVADVKIRKRARWGYKVNFSMTLPGKKQIYADEVDKKLPTAIRKLRAQVIRQLKEYRGKLGTYNRTKVPLAQTAEV